MTFWEWRRYEGQERSKTPKGEVIEMEEKPEIERGTEGKLGCLDICSFPPLAVINTGWLTP